MSKTKEKLQLHAKLIKLHDLMIDCASDLSLIYGKDRKETVKQILGAATMVFSWVDGIQEEINEERKDA